MQACCDYLENCLLTLINNLDFDCWVLDSDFRYVLQNHHSINQWGNVVGKRIDDLDIPEEMKQEWKTQSLKSLNGDVIQIQYEIEPAGDNRFFESTISPLKMNGDIIGVIGVTRDITRFKSTELRLQSQKIELEEINTALQVILKKREDDRFNMEKKVLGNLEKTVYPVIDALYRISSDKQRSMLDIIRGNLDELTLPFSHDLKFLSFTNMEIQVVNYIKSGKTTKEIADLMGVAKSTVDTHRNHIRKKLNLKNKGVGLKTFLNAI